MPAAILIVGDEILAGHTQDTNSHYLANRLRGLGIRLARIVACGDPVDDIAQQVSRLIHDGLDPILVCGGIGPTPDDRTYEAVAIATETPLAVAAGDAQWMRERVAQTGYGRDLLEDEARSEALWRMVRRPEGSRRILNPVGAALGSLVEHRAARIIVLPGVPRELRAMMEQEVETLLQGGQPEAVREIRVRGEEAHLYPLLREAEARFPDVRFGSYPQDEKGTILLRISGAAGALAPAVEFLRRGLEQGRKSGAPRLI